MKKLLFLLPLLALVGFIHSENSNPKNAFVNANGCVECDNYDVGDVFVLNGKTMIVADRSMLDEAVSNDDDLTQFCTSKITDMQGMFFEAYSFNQDIGNWDVSNVKHMSNMFTDTYSFNQDLTQWCVSNFSSMPVDFSTNSALSASNHPVWGTCP